MKKTIKQLFKVAVGIVLGIIITYGVLVFLFWWNIRPITNVSAFERVMNKRWHNPDLIKHFPNTIPIGAKEPKFFYRPGFLQGGSTIELRMIMPREFVDDEIRKFKSNAKILPIPWKHWRPWPKNRSRPSRERRKRPNSLEIRSSKGHMGITASWSNISLIAMTI